MAGLLSSIFGASKQPSVGQVLDSMSQGSLTSSGLAAQQQQTAQTNINTVGQLQNGALFSTNGPIVTYTGIPATTVYYSPDWSEELKQLKELVYSMRHKITKLEGEIIRLHSTGEGKDAAADDILRQMDCYTSV